MFNSTAMQIRKTQFRQRFRNWLNNAMAINAYDLSDDNVDNAIEAIERFQPRYLHGYVSALYTIARRMAEHNRSFRKLKLTAVITESEKLYDFQREAMQEAFDCAILEHYGSVELGNIAQQDPDGYLRIAEDLCKVEVEDNGGVLVTNLLTLAYPFIRYRLGDLVEIAEQPNARFPYAVIKNVIGRTVDLIPIKAGGYLHGVALAHVIDRHLQFVTRYQVHQLAIDRFRVKLVAKHDMPEKVPQRIASDMRLLVGADTQIDIELVDQILPAPSGKFRWVISDISDAAEQALAEARMGA
jgi:phenylacetate-CoA ligase